MNIIKIFRSEEFWNIQDENFNFMNIIKFYFYALNKLISDVTLILKS